MLNNKLHVAFYHLDLKTAKQVPFYRKNFIFDNKLSQIHRTTVSKSNIYTHLTYTRRCCRLTVRTAACNGHERFRQDYRGCRKIRILHKTFYIYDSMAVTCCRAQRKTRPCKCLTERILAYAKHRLSYRNVVFGIFYLDIVKFGNVTEHGFEAVAAACNEVEHGGHGSCILEDNGLVVPPPQLDHYVEHGSLVEIEVSFLALKAGIDIHFGHAHHACGTERDHAARLDYESRRASGWTDPHAALDKGHARIVR